MFPPLNSSLYFALNHCYMSDAPAPVVSFFKKGRTRPTNTRTRLASPDVAAKSVLSGSSAGSEVVVPMRKAASGLLSQGTKRTREERAAEELDAASDSRALDVHWAASGGTSASTTALEILAGDAAEELDLKRQKRVSALDEDVGLDDGLYHGMKAYGGKIKKSQEVAKSMRVGPQRTSGSTIRTVTMIDYQPDVCKDYKGVCALGAHNVSS